MGELRALLGDAEMGLRGWHWGDPIAVLLPIGSLGWGVEGLGVPSVGGGGCYGVSVGSPMAAPWLDVHRDGGDTEMGLWGRHWGTPWLLCSP